MKKNISQQYDNFLVLQRISNFISSINDIHRLLSLIMEESKEILDAEASSLLLYDPGEKKLFFEVATGEKGRAVKRVKLGLGQGIAGACARERRIINVKDVLRDKRFYTGVDEKTKFATRNILAIPLVRKNKLLGVLEVLNKRGGGCFTEKDEELMAIIANQASLCIENARLYETSVKNARLAGVGETMLSLSHDIKNILNGLVGGVSLLDETLHSVEGDYVQESWGIVKANVNRISELILDMLNFSSKKKPLFQEVSLDAFIENTLSVYREKLSEKKTECRYEHEGKLSNVYIDTSGMQRVLLNLFTNALEAVPEERGCITVSTRFSGVAGLYRIDVQDNGCGIPRENLKNMFDVFFTTKGHKGTGLGLAVVKKIVEEHKGTVEVSSEPGKGTVFSLNMPLNPLNGKRSKK